MRRTCLDISPKNQYVSDHSEYHHSSQEAAIKILDKKSHLRAVEDPSRAYILSPEKMTASAGGRDTDTSILTWQSNELKLTEAKLVLPSATKLTATMSKDH